MTAGDEVVISVDSIFVADEDAEIIEMADDKIVLEIQGGGYDGHKVTITKKDKEEE